MGKKLTISVIIIIAAITGYWWFFLQTPVIPIPPPDGETDYDTIAETWKSRGIALDYYHSNLPAVSSLEENQLQEIKADFSALKNDFTKPEEIALLEVYSDFTNLAIENKRLAELEEEILFTGENICDELPLLQNYLTQLELTNLAFENFIASSNEFSRNYRESAESIEFYEIGNSYIAKQEFMKIHYEEIKSVEQVCA